MAREVHENTPAKLACCNECSIPLSSDCSRICIRVRSSCYGFAPEGPRRPRLPQRSDSLVTPPNHPVSNILTVDVEEYFHPTEVQAFITPTRWGTLPSRVERQLQLIL